MSSLKYFSMRVLIIFVLLSLLTLPGCVPETFKFRKEVGKSGRGRGEFIGATDIAMTPDGNLVVADAGNNRFQVISPNDGTVKFTGGEYGTTGLKLQSVAGCGVNPTTGDIFICDYRGGKIVKFDKTGNAVARIIDKVHYPMDAACDSSGNCYVIMSKQPGINKYDILGNFVEIIGGKGKSALVYATSIHIVGQDMYVADFGSRRILKMSLKGEVKQEFSQKGEYEPLKGPSAVSVDSTGNLYALDLGEVPAVVLDAQGGLISRIGGFGSEPGQFLYPRGIACTESGDIYIIDNSRNVLLHFQKAAQ
ncbi:MAG: NHL repeat-containing protein [Candidatus Riflebacteria bacterium]|nr:NHL repeat-containing protein [Candidatus Riflebacteria bacterium]